MRAIVAAVAIAALAASASAQTAPDVSGFVGELVAAINSKSVARRQGLLHSGSARCMSGEAAPFYEHIVMRQARETVPPNPQWSVAPIAADEPLMLAEKFDYPVRPTHALQLTFSPGPNRSTTMLVQLVQESGRWREVVPCPKPETLVEARAAMQERVKQEARVRELAAKIAPDLRERVLRLYNDGRRIDAYREYERVSGEDLTTAVAVVDLLAGKPR